MGMTAPSYTLIITIIGRPGTPPVVYSIPGFTRLELAVAAGLTYEAGTQNNGLRVTASTVQVS
jgi:hypothetical protein